MEFEELALKATTDAMKTVGAMVTYRDATGDREVMAVVDLDQASFAVEPAATDTRWTVSFARAEVQSPSRGDTVTTSDGTKYELQEEILDAPGFSDAWFTTWTADIR